ncbi:hypothetical protein TrRE_jg10436 [Triparma retinervis]|uniref:MATE efflux family protein n=1 Tax=Triparma retinervis TaxID=2557542 RepID=A0A9W7DZK1_9STRA|nr:hypothetical protein TrRE_jg10436 [Triparma retinervis]
MLVVGGMSGNDTLNPVVYQESPQNLHAVVIRGFLICILLLVVPLLTFYVPLSEPLSIRILRTIGIVDELLLGNVQAYLQAFGLFLPFAVVYEAAKRYLVCQGIIYPIAFSGLMGVGLHWVMVVYWGIGSIPPIEIAEEIDPVVTAGVLRRVAVTHGLQPLFVVYFLGVYCYFKSPHDPVTLPWGHGGSGTVRWGVVTSAPRVRKHVGLSLSGILSLSEWLYWEIQTFLISSLNDRLFMTAQAVVQSMVPLFYMAPLGLSIASGVIIGREIGMGEPSKVRKSTGSVMNIGIALSLTMGFVVLALKNHLISFYTNDPEVVAKLDEMWAGVVMFVVADQLFCVQGKILVSLGLQSSLAKLVFGSLYVVGIPLIYLHGIKDGGGIVEVWNVAWVPYAILNGGMWAVRRRVDYKAVVEELREGKGGKGQYRKVGEEEEGAEEDEEVWEDAMEGGEFEGDFDDDEEEEGLEMRIQL